MLVFEGFKIGRYLTAEVVDPYLTMVNSDNAYAGNSRSEALNRYRSTSKSAEGWRISGERPNSNRYWYLFMLAVEVKLSIDIDQAFL